MQISVLMHNKYFNTCTYKYCEYWRPAVWKQTLIGSHGNIVPMIHLLPSRCHVALQVLYLCCLISQQKCLILCQFLRWVCSGWQLNKNLGILSPSSYVTPTFELRTPAHFQHIIIAHFSSLWLDS